MKAQFFHYKIIEIKPIEALHEFKDHRRLQTFFHKGCKCVECGREATQIALGQASGKGGRHWDLYDDNFYPLTVDHIIPRSKGGPDTLDNYQPMCYGCNQTKGNGDKLNGSYGHACKWPRAKKMKELVSVEMGIFVFQKANKGKSYKPLGRVLQVGVNPHTGRPALKVDLRPNSWFHFSQLGKI
jgi:hypothetical protein